MTPAARLTAAIQLDMPALVALYLATHAVLGRDAWAPGNPEYALKQALWHIGRGIHGAAFVHAVHKHCRYDSGEDWQANQSRVAA